MNQVFKSDIWEQKNNLWRINYIFQFVKKHQFDEKGI